MLLQVAEATAGLILAAITLRDVFDTVVVPGRSRGSLRVSRRLVFGALALWKAVRRAPIGTGFAPVVLVASFATWMLLLILAFACMVLSASASFAPAPDSFGEAMYIAASAMSTTGTGGRKVEGFAALIASVAGFTGLAVMTLAVTYLLEVQGNIAARDKRVLQMITAAGDPPSALALLQRYAKVGAAGRLDEVAFHARDWCADVMQSHLSHPSLIYFRSAGTGAGWPAVLGALMDLALILELLLDEPDPLGPALLMRDEAARLANGILEMLSLQPVRPRTSESEVRQLCDALATAGYCVKQPCGIDAFITTRNELLGGVAALAEHLGAPQAPLVRRS
ncbi:MAG: two pore domain potassium channel family protein [Ramlibacter sp.]|jgi:hypothetical protein|nr:two pore domain potassium channel family protein [Ramlibacter sp.]